MKLPESFFDEEALLAFADDQGYDLDDTGEEPVYILRRPGAKRRSALYVEVGHGPHATKWERR